MNRAEKMTRAEHDRTRAPIRSDHEPSGAQPSAGQKERERDCERVYPSARFLVTMPVRFPWLAVLGMSGGHRTGGGLTDKESTPPRGRGHMREGRPAASHAASKISLRSPGFGDHRPLGQGPRAELPGGMVLGARLGAPRKPQGARPGNRPGAPGRGSIRR